MTTTCEAPNCGGKIHAKGYCTKHYYKMKRTGTLDPIKPGPKRTTDCSVPHCDRDHYAKGYCRFHYYTAKKSGGDPLALPRSFVKGPARFNETGDEWCSKCQTFVSPPRRDPKGWCNECLRENGRVRRYGITEDQFQSLLASQNNLCLICNKPDPDVVDHDHSCCPGRETCGECVRGILHRPCNATLGTVEPNLTRIIQYLQKGNA